MSKIELVAVYKSLKHPGNPKKKRMKIPKDLYPDYEHVLHYLAIKDYDPILIKVKCNKSIKELKKMRKNFKEQDKKKKVRRIDAIIYLVQYVYH